MSPGTLDAVSPGARLVRLIDDRVIKRVTRLLLRLGLAPRAFALLETTGRRSGLPRQTPVGNGLIRAQHTTPAVVRISIDRR